MLVSAKHKFVPAITVLVSGGFGHYKTHGHTIIERGYSITCTGVQFPGPLAPPARYMYPCNSYPKRQVMLNKGIDNPITTQDFYFLCGAQKGFGVVDYGT